MRTLLPSCLLVLSLPLAAVAYPYRDNQAMQKAMTHYQVIADRGGWGTIADGKILEKGDSGPRVAALIRRLAAEDYLPADRHEDFDAGVEKAVRAYQSRARIGIDGRVGPETRSSLNISAAQRVEQLALNLERMNTFYDEHLSQEAKRRLEEQMPPVAQDRHVLVNIPDFRVHLIEAGSSVYDSKAITGSYWWQTPRVHSAIHELIINPQWNIPTAIAVNEIAPAIAEDFQTIEERGLVVLEKPWIATDNRQVDPRSIAWDEVTMANFDYFMRQQPGDENPLGRVQFHFPNDHNIFLHDTPKDDLFQDHERDLSHGCIRVSEPFELAHRLTQSDGRFEILLDSAQTHELPLETRVPIHVVYWTAWVDDAGTVIFRDDIYGHDPLGES